MVIASKMFLPKFTGVNKSQDLSCAFSQSCRVLLRRCPSYFSLTKLFTTVACDKASPKTPANALLALLTNLLYFKRKLLEAIVKLKTNNMQIRLIPAKGGDLIATTVSPAKIMTAAFGISKS